MKPGTAWYIQSPQEGPVVVCIKVRHEMELTRMQGKVGKASKELTFVKCLLFASLFTKKCVFSLCMLAMTHVLSLGPRELVAPYNQRKSVAFSTQLEHTFPSY